jgi:hypothetical protein
MELAEAAAGELCVALRPDACALVDAWDFDDMVLNSTIGRKDGNVYEAQYQAAAASPLNTKAVPDFLAGACAALRWAGLVRACGLTPRACVACCSGAAVPQPRLPPAAQRPPRGRRRPVRPPPRPPRAHMQAGRQAGAARWMLMQLID